MKRSTTAIQPGEAIPAGEPSRYINVHGYVVLRWKVAPYTYRDLLEHRFVLGNPAGVVHHRNAIKTDNRPDNLDAIGSQGDHMREHMPPTFDVPAAIVDYKGGMSLPQLQRKYGTHHTNIYRTMRAHGFTEFRTQRKLDGEQIEQIRSLRALGVTQRAVAERFGVSQPTVHRVCADPLAELARRAWADDEGAEDAG